MKYNYYVQAVDEVLKLKEKLGREKDKEDIKKIKDFINAKNINCLRFYYNATYLNKIISLPNFRFLL